MVEAGAVVHHISKHIQFSILSEYLCFSEKSDPAVIKVLLRAGVDIRPDMLKSNQRSIVCSMVRDKFTLLKVRKASELTSRYERFTKLGNELLTCIFKFL